MDEFDLNDGFDNQTIMQMRIRGHMTRNDWLFPGNVVPCRRQ